MKTNSQKRHTSSVTRLLAMMAGIAVAAFMQNSNAATYTWSGGGSDGLMSTGSNWVGDLAPSATGDSLVFDGNANLSVSNDFITSLGSTSITFAAGAGSFDISGNTLTVGGTTGNDNFVTKISTADQTISANINLAGTGKDRTIIMTGGGTLTLSGNVNFSNDWLFPSTSAGTIVLSGNNSGDGKGSVLVSGANVSRAMMRNNVAGTQLVLGSDTALGNSGSGDVGLGTANFRGLVANQNMSISTAGGNRSLAGSTIIINTANVTFNGANNLTVGNLISQGGNRDFWVTSTGTMTVGSSLSLSNDATGRSLYVNLTGAGGMVVNGKIYDTFLSTGLTSGTSTLRKAGTGMLTLNGSSSYTGLTTVEAGTLKIGDASALGVSGTNSGTTLTGNATVDLNGFSIGETLTINNSGNKLVNTSASAAAVSADATITSNLTVDTTGDITTARLIASNPYTITKEGAGTLTTSGTNHNSLTAWVVNNGTVVFANTSGLAADRGVTINSGTLQLSGLNSNLINDGQAFAMTGGVFDLNGKGEAVSVITGSTGVVTNSSATAATLYVGGGSSGTTSGTSAVAYTNGAGVLNLTKEGTGTIAISGSNSYTGTTTVANGTLVIGNADALGSTSTGVAITSGTLDLNGYDDLPEPVSISGGALINNNSGDGSTYNIDLTNQGSFSVGGAGNLVFQRINRNVTGYTVTKIGTGTVTLSGSQHNNLYQWTVNDGTLELAKTVAGQLAVDRALTINGGTVKIVGSGGNQMNNSEDVTINGGTLDLFGHGEAIGGLQAAAAGGIVTNSSTTAATFYVGGSTSGSSNGSYAGAVQDGAGVLGLTKEGSGTQTLSGSNTYTGATSVNGGVLNLGKTLSTSASVSVANGAALKLTGSLMRLDTSGLSVSGSGMIDVKTNAMVIRAAAGLSVSQVGLLVRNGQNSGPSQYWDGFGINSSAAANDVNAATAVGYVDNSQTSYTNVSGDTFTGDPGNLDGVSADILVKYTYYGDGNLDGVVNGADFDLFVAGKGGSLSATWLSGDFNNDGVVNGADFDLFVAGKGAYVGGGGPIPAGGGGAGPASVPEPGSVALLLAGAAGLLGMRRRR